MNSTLLALERFLTLSEDMSKAAVEQDWEGLVRTEKERGEIFKHLPDNLPARLPQADQARARTIIERCLGLDAQVHSIAADRNKSLRVLLREPKL